MPFLSSFGRLPGTSFALALVVLSGLAEGIGLALFVPLLNLMFQGGEQTLGFPFDRIQLAFDLIGVSVTLPPMLAIIFLLIITSLGINFIQRRMIVRIRLQFSRDARREYVGALYSADWPYISGKSHGDAFNEFLNECNRASLALQYQLLSVASAIQIAIYVGVSAMVSWQHTLVTLAFGGVIFGIVRPLQLQARELGDKQTTANRNLSFYIIDFLRGAKIIKSTANEGRVIGELWDHVDAEYNVSSRQEINGLQIYFVVQALPVVLIAGLIGLSHYAFTPNASMTIGFLLILSRIAPRLAQFQQSSQSYNTARPALPIVDRVIEEARQNAEKAGNDGIAFTQITEAIVLNEVSFRYPTRESFTLSGVSIEIPRQKMVAIVGSSGAGKSTIMDMLAGLRMPDDGKITIDKKPLGEYDLTSWRKRIGYVAQDLVVFNDTLANNVTFSCPGATEGDIREALEIARLSKLIEELPEGLQTMIGENGIRLSGGQRQRLAIARAIIGKPELLLLDEATSALDNESERLVQQALEAIAKEFTLVVIAHRLTTVRHADIIYVMEGGQVVQTGKYNDLVAQDGIFRQLHSAGFE